MKEGAAREALSGLDAAAAAAVGGEEAAFSTHV
jgi:hypothetical protein